MCRRMRMQPEVWAEPIGGSGVCIAVADDRHPMQSTARETAMNWDQIQGNWKQMVGKAKEKWGDLTDDELDQAEGKRDQMVGLVQAKYGKAKEAAEAEVDSWTKGL
jgi:uncharacterized protein YjbJ (UPF0337 family)